MSVEALTYYARCDQFFFPYAKRLRRDEEGVHNGRLLFTVKRPTTATKTEIRLNICLGNESRRMTLKQLRGSKS